MEEDVLKSFGRRIRELRRAAQLSQEDFAAECGLDRSYLAGVERGEHNIALRNIQVIARTLGISLEELMNGV